MNRFRTKKKAKEEALPRPSQESESQRPFRLFGKGKKIPEEEPKKEFDIAAALPPSDDFRTSLLMSGLSARFSMLKEQDDPSSKIGKASDDSVLFPNRASRMDFGGTGLGDIAEVESIRAPPSFSRMDSFHSSEGSMSGSMMDRGKPTEGNNLFGGRQKIYKIPTAGNSKSGEGSSSMGGKAIYENDVSMSSFQQWKQAEKNRRSMEGEDQFTWRLDLPQAESPPPTGYNRNRETNSTTSSAPSAGRDSTAATSVMSQPTNPKDLQPIMTGSASGTGTSVIRARRLYESGLMNDLQENQSSALSRIDTLSRRNQGSRTPELSNGPSPTNPMFSERSGERRVMGKASAPNLRPKSPTTTSPTVGPMNLGIRMPSNPDTRSSHTSPGGAPPLSPPISESEESSPFTVQPNDRGKATALGMFSKPAQVYDEAAYAQKQIQLQRGRETPTNRIRAESNTSQTNRTRSRSRSSSSAQRLPFERQDSTTIRKEPTVEEESTAPASTFLDMDDDQPPMDQSHPPKRNLNSPPRPSDQDHPVFRSAVLPTPMSMDSRVSEGRSATDRSATEQHGLLSPPSQRPSPAASPADSPTLGPVSSGLSGIVRQHMRAGSDGSSIYGGAEPNDAHGPSDKYPSHDPYNMNDLDVPSNPWAARESRYLQPSRYGDTKTETAATVTPDQKETSPSGTPAATPLRPQSSESAKEPDEFARHLADGARRVREKLTTYVESESRDVSPQPPESRDGPPSRPNALNLLRSKSSRGSLVDRNRNQDSSKVPKMPTLGAPTMSSSPSPSKRSFDNDRDPLSPMDEEPERTEAEPEPQPDAQAVSTQAEENVREEKEESDENMHAGLRAFRQARRELQKMKEVDVQRRRQDSAPQPPPTHPPPPRPGPPSHEQSHGSRPSSRGRAPPPPAFFQHRIPSDESKQGTGPSRSSSRPPSRTDRDRSESINSNGSRSRSRPPMLRDVSVPYEGLTPNGPHGPHGPSHGPPNGHPRPGRSPGLPGTDIRKSPIMPPQGKLPPGTMNGPPNGPPTGPLPGPPGHFDRPPTGSPRLQVQARGPPGNQSSSPISPMAPIPSPYGNPGMHSGSSTPVGPSHRRPSQPPAPGFDTNGVTRLDDSMRKSIRKRDISEPTFVSSTSRVPTVGLPESESRPGESQPGSGSRSRSGSVLNSTASTPNLHAQATSQAPAPPLPPINPRRRNMSGFRGRPLDGEPNANSPNLASHPNDGIPQAQAEGQSSFSVSDEEDGQNRERRRLRKATSEANGINVRARQAQFGGGAQAPPPMPPNRPRMPGGMI